MARRLVVLAIAAALTAGLIPGAAPASNHTQSKSYLGNSLDGRWLQCQFGGGGACFDIPGTIQVGSMLRSPTNAAITVSDATFPYVAAVYEVWGTWSRWGSGCSGNCYTLYGTKLYSGGFCGSYGNANVTQNQTYYDPATQIWTQYNPEEIKVLVGAAVWTAQYCSSYIGSAGPGTRGSVAVAYS